MTSKSSELGSFSFSNKYRGFLEQSFYKKVRTHYFGFVSYCFSEAPNLDLLHLIITVWRLYQYVTPIFLSGCASLFEGTGMIKKFVDFLSILSLFVPTDSRKGISTWISVPYAVFFVAFFSYILVCSLYLSKHGHLNRIFINIFIYYVSSLNFIIHPFTGYYCGELIGYLCHPILKKQFNFGLCLFSVILILCFYAVFTWFFINILSISTTFRTTSLMSTSPVPSIWFWANHNLITVILSITTHVEKGPQIVIMAVCAALYFEAGACVFIEGGFVRPRVSLFVATFSVSCSLSLIIKMFLVIYNKKMSEIILLADIFIMIISFLVFVMIFKRLNLSILRKLDLMIEDENCFDKEFKSVSMFATANYYGFSIAHPVCVSWKLCRAAVEKWPNKISVWFVYAKFIAIYPEETQTLISIANSISQNHIKGGYAKETLEQIHTLVLRREANLSPYIKEKIGTLTKTIDNSKRQLRNVWDSIIQGNYTETMNGIHQVFRSSTTLEAEFEHLISRYPNNRFVTRSHARFLLEIMADYTAYEKMDEKAHLLQRGMLVTEDKAHELGLKAFPLLPDMIKPATSMGGIYSSTSEVDVTTTEIIEQPDSLDIISKLSSTIDDITIPSLRSMKIARWSYTLFIMCLALLSFAIYGLYYIINFQKPLDFMRKLTLLRTSTTMLVPLSHRYILEEAEIVDKNPSINTKEKLIKFQKLANSLAIDLSDFENYMIGNEYLDQARSEIFRTSVIYKSFVSIPPAELEMTAYSGLNDILIQVQKLVEVQSVSCATMNQNQILNIILNIEIIITQFYTCLDYIVLFLQKRYDLAVRNIVIWVCVFDIFVVVVWAIIVIISEKKYKSDLLVIFTALYSIPKNIVSSISDKLKVIKTNGTEIISSSSDVTKQEENVLKIFSTANSQSNFKTAASALVIFELILSSLFFISGTVILFAISLKSSKTVVNVAPQINYVLLAFTLQMSEFLIAQIYASSFTDCSILVFSKDKLRESFYKFSVMYDEYFNFIRYGSKNGSIIPFQQFFTFQPQNNNKPDYNFVDNSLVMNMDPELKSLCLYLYMKKFFTFISIYSSSTISPIGHPNDNIYKLGYQVIILDLFENFYYPFIDALFDLITNDVMNNTIPSFISIIFIIVILILMEALMTLYNSYLRKEGRFALHLFVQCPPTICLQTPRIATLLAGNFDRKSTDITTRTNEYFDEVFMLMPDAIILLDNQNNVVQVNKSTMRLFGYISDSFLMDDDIPSPYDFDFIGKPFSTLFEHSGEANYEIYQTIQESNDVDIIFIKEGENLHLHVTKTMIKMDTIITLRDITQTVRYNTLIQEEKRKSDNILASILPAKLVSRVSKGEVDINFSVQSASIVFMDIVEFTPWCASLTAEEVMLTLNRMFTKFDAIVTKYPMMTKVKCIGDCYMAAGGIFAEVNQPEIHSKEAVEFGLDSIQAVKDLDKEFNLDRKIRVGVNSGGPIVAGVLGTEKPTFEIIGPAINMAQQMEHHGVPMAVHISRSVYEMIYGGSFEVKERSPIEIKGGKVVTYLVSGRLKSN